MAEPEYDVPPDDPAAAMDEAVQDSDKTRAEEEPKAAPPKAKREVLLDEINNHYAVILNVGGHCVVADLVPSPDDKAPVQLITFDNFTKRFANKYVPSDEASKPKQVGRWWLTHRRRREYQGLVLEPRGPTIIGIKGREYFNLWRGFGIMPKPGDWSMMREHMRIILANGDKGFEDYLLRWAAFAVQRPSERAEVAVVLKGKKGSGKTVFGQAIMDFFGGMHGKTQSDPKRLTGQFNGFLRDTILLFLDEMRWNSRRDDEGILQTLITGKTIFIEDKNIPQFEWPNRLHIIICSNADRVIPATEGERRYAVGETNNKFAKDECPDAERERYFTALHQELEGGGRAAMLHDLLNFELGDFHPRVGYRTAALQLEKRQGVTGFDAYYQLLLEDGYLPGKAALAPNRALSRDLYHDMQARVPDLKFTAQNQLGVYFGHDRCEVIGIKPWRTADGNGWEFPPLADLRAEWERRQGGWKWPNNLTTWEFSPEKKKEDSKIVSAGLPDK